jgi:alpha-D-ribose 1-methylphosphonate 5-triphosphate synthase subunit PhnH
MSVVRTAPLLSSSSTFKGFIDLPVRAAAPGAVAWSRRALLSRPGAVIELDAPPDLPQALHAATAMIASTLFDQDTRVWLSSSLDCASVRKYLCSQTASIRSPERTLADFAIAARPGERPSLGAFHCGTLADPGHSSKLIIQVDSLEDAGPVRLAGPGIQGAKSIAARGLGEAFFSEWARNAGLFPRGVDVFLVCANRLCFLPRTTRIEA